MGTWVRHRSNERFFAAVVIGCVCCLRNLLGLLRPFFVHGWRDLATGQSTHGPVRSPLLYPSGGVDQSLHRLCSSTCAADVEPMARLVPRVRPKSTSDPNGARLPLDRLRGRHAALST